MTLTQFRSLVQVWQADHAEVSAEDFYDFLGETANSPGRYADLNIWQRCQFMDLLSNCLSLPDYAPPSKSRH